MQSEADGKVSSEIVDTNQVNAVLISRNLEGSESVWSRIHNKETAVFMNQQGALQSEGIGHIVSSKTTIAKGGKVSNVIQIPVVQSLMGHNFIVNSQVCHGKHDPCVHAQDAHGQEEENFKSGGGEHCLT